MSKVYNLNMKQLEKLDKVVDNLEDLTLDVVKESVKDLIKDANTPVNAGGRMRVDTGFLRSSGTGAINEIPRGETEGRRRSSGETGVIYDYKGSSALQAILQKLKIGDILYYGWTARYAEIRELYDGFLEAAVQKWNEIVDNNVRRLKK